MSNEIYHYTDEDGDSLRLTDLGGCLIFRTGFDAHLNWVYMDPEDAVALRDALSEAIDRNGWHSR